jgi:hypothetical protein
MPRRHHTRTDTRSYVASRKRAEQDDDAVTRQFYCIDCGIELDQNDVDANLTTWGVFKCLCSDDIENHVED